MRLPPLPDSEYQARTARVQAELARAGLDVFIGYSSESESAISRYLTGFWPFFDFCCVVVPAHGRAMLVTGGPESYEFALRFARVAEVRVNPLLVETSPPDWVPEVKGESFATLLAAACGSAPRRIGVGSWNTIPHTIIEDVRKGAPKAELVPCDDLLWRVQAVKSDAEIPYIAEVYRITEESMKAAFAAVKPGMAEWELDAVARSVMLKQGAEGTPYPPWVCSGPTTPLSLCRSTDRAIGRDELVQFTFGAKYMGYSGNMCRPFAIGHLPKPARKLIDVSLEAMHYALGAIRPGRAACDVFQGYHEILARYGFENMTLYGPRARDGSLRGRGPVARARGALPDRAQHAVQHRHLALGRHIRREIRGRRPRHEGRLRELSSWRREAIEL